MSAFFDRLHVGDHVLQEKEPAVADSRKTSAETAGEAQRFGLSQYVRLNALPTSSKGRYGREVVEALSGVLIMAQ